ncbi:MAG TPA: cache domain-containing protein [Syntrophorhabdaceae bacterium]|jgi:signal transduction histidine kinase
MKKNLFFHLCVLVAALGMVCAAGAASQEEAKIFAEKAAAFAKANGKEKAVAEFNNPGGQFVKGDLYIFANDLNGTCLANGASPQLAGKNLLGLRDSANKLFFKEMTDVAAAKGGGWVEYSWTNPATKKVQAKITWIKKVEGADYYVGCGVYK